MIVYLDILTDVYKRGEDDSLILVKKDVKINKQFETTKIEIEQFTNELGRILNKYSTINVEGATYKVATPYKKLQSMISPIIVKGFIKNSKNYKKYKH